MDEFEPETDPFYTQALFIQPSPDGTKLLTGFNALPIEMIPVLDTILGVDTMHAFMRQYEINVSHDSVQYVQEWEGPAGSYLYSADYSSSSEYIYQSIARKSGPEAVPHFYLQRIETAAMGASSDSLWSNNVMSEINNVPGRWQAMVQ